MRIDVLTLFPGMMLGYLDASILQRAQQSGKARVCVHNIRDFATGKHRVTDEPPYGGGGGMVLKPEPLFAAVESITGHVNIVKSDGTVENRQEFVGSTTTPILLMTPQGRPFSQKIASEITKHDRILIICGRYEGVDERVRKWLVTDEISIGDFVLTGGELPALVVIDAVIRLIPGVLGADNAADTDSYSTGLLEGPHYTRPDTFRGISVPEVLRSGHAANILRWRREQSLRRTWQRRPEMLLAAVLSEEDKQFLALLAEEQSAR